MPERDPGELARQLAAKDGHFVFIDESRWNGDRKTPGSGWNTLYVAVGVAATRYEDFAGRHDELLASFGLPSVIDPTPGEFHAKEIQHQHGCWKHRTVGDRVRALDSMARLVEEFTDRAYYVWMSDVEFQAIRPQISPTRVRKAGLSYWDLRRAKDASEKSLYTSIPRLFEGSRVVLVADRRANDADGFLPLYEPGATTVAGDGVYQADSRRFAGIQLADMLAYGICRVCTLSAKLWGQVTQTTDPEQQVQIVADYLANRALDRASVRLVRSLVPSRLIPLVGGNPLEEICGRGGLRLLFIAFDELSEPRPLDQES